MISYYKELNPYIEILLTEVGTKRIRQEIEAGELDVGLVCSVTSTNESLETIRFLKDPLMLIVHESHLLAAKESIQLSKLANETFIIYRKDFILYDRIIEECSKQGFFPTIACETTQKDLFIEMVQAKLGIALLPKKLAEKSLTIQSNASHFRKKQSILNWVLRGRKINTCLLQYGNLLNLPGNLSPNRKVA